MAIITTGNKQRMVAAKKMLNLDKKKKMLAPNKPVTLPIKKPKNFLQ
jgi:ribosomal protein L21